MKKNNISLLGLAMMVMSLTIVSALIGCKFNLSDNKYLSRPDVDKKDSYIMIRGPYESSKLEYISVYKQDVTDSKNSEIIRAGVIFPAGFNKEDQTYIFYDYNILYGRKYRYYVRFVEKDGSKNRTEWSNEIQSTDSNIKTSGSFKYTVPSDAVYIYDPGTFMLELPAGKNFAIPDAIDNYTDPAKGYKAALVFEHDDVIQAFEISNPNSVSLKELLPKDYLYVDIKLLGILGQKKEYQEDVEIGKEPELKYLIWTELADVKIENQAGNEIKTIRMEPEHGEAGYDYSIDSDNEN